MQITQPNLRILQLNVLKLLCHNIQLAITAQKLEHFDMLISAAGMGRHALVFIHWYSM